MQPQKSSAGKDQGSKSARNQAQGAAAAPTGAGVATEAGGAARPSPASIPCFDPATLEPLGDVRVWSRKEVEEAIVRARRAQAVWGKTSFADRRRVLRALLDHLLEHADELCEIIVKDSGKTLENAIMGEIWPIAEKIRWTLRDGEKHLRPERMSPGLLLHKSATIEYHPLGVIGVICPWNFPLQNVLGPTIPALFAGNGVIIKVSEWTSWSAARFQRIFDEVLSSCGYPRELVQIVTGYAETGAAVVSGGVDKVVFTGSMPNGRRVIEESAKTLTPVILELGGKDPMIVCDDADLEEAAHWALSAVFISSGQMCLASERILVMDGIYDPFVARVVEIGTQLRQGPAAGRPGQIDVGAMTMPAQVDLVERQVKDAVAKGAKVLLGGKRGQGSKGQFFEPTILSGVTPDMAIAREETFGPVMSIFRVKDEEEAIALANSTEYGLGSTVFTTSQKRAKRIASQLVAGSTCVNAYGMNYMAQDLPFGGVRGSGYGRLNGREGLRGMCNVKSVVADRLPLHQPVKQYPVKPGDYERTRAVIRLIYGGSLAARARGLLDLVRKRRGAEGPR